MTLFQHQRMWLFSGSAGPGGFNSLYQMSFQQWNRFSPCGPRSSQTPLCSWGFILPTRALPGIKLQSCRLSAPLVYRVLVAFKPALFSFLPFQFSPCGCFHFSTFSPPALVWRVLFPSSPTPHPVSVIFLQAKTVPCPLWVSPSEPRSPLCTTYLLSSVVQVVQIVVLILKSVFQVCRMVQC